MKISKKSAEHYNWGQNCDGWRLIDTASLSVIQEHMPPNTEETMHFHQKSQQFFFILSGTAVFELDEKVFEIQPNEGFHIKPGQIHKIKNNGPDELHFLVISEPKTQEDRINI